MAVRTHLAWPWRLGLMLAFFGVVAGMWWWGFDFGQLLGGFNRREIEAQLSTLTADLTVAQREAVELRAQNTQLASDLAMMRGTQSTLYRQQAALAQENASLKDELSFLQSFFADATKSTGLTIHRLTLEANGDGVARYSVLLVRGAGAKGEFEGHMAVVADLAPRAEAPAALKPVSITLPDDRPEAAAPMRLRFKYYQRLEGTVPVPAGYAVRAVTARVYEAGAPAPRATRTLTLP
jgi:hypothetical protein